MGQRTRVDVAKGIAFDAAHANVSVVLRDAGMHAIKVYAWEGPYVERITELRNEEVTQIRRAFIVAESSSHSFAASNDITQRVVWNSVTC